MAANMQVVRAEWRARTLSEYRQASVASEFLTWLIRLGFGAETLQTAHRILGNELDHADMSFEVHSALGGGDDVLDVAEGTLVLPHAFGRPTFERAVLAAVDVFCVGETLAWPLWQAMQGVVKESGPRQVLDRIVADAPLHRDFGWSVLDEALERDRATVEALAGKDLPGIFGRVERAWGVLPDDWMEPVGPQEQVWLVPRARYKREFYQAIAEDVLPRLEERNLNGRAAWGKRSKVDGAKK